jgi:uncharacterized protein (DUF433 family)
VVFVGPYATDTGLLEQGGSIPYPSCVDYRDRIGIDPAIRSGKPTIRNTRITVSDILEYLAGGMSQEEILADFPDLTAEDISAALLFAAERERRLFSTSV